MAWGSADERHEGYIECVFADGFAGSGWHVDGISVTTAPDGSWIPYEDQRSRPASAVTGWRAACDCNGRTAGWHCELWTLVPVTEVKNRVLNVPDDQVADIED